jgi:hypothetical protein
MRPSLRPEQYGPAADFGKPPPFFACGTLPGMITVGRLAQMVGLVLPGCAIILELNHRITLGQMLVMLVASVCCFWIGRIIEGYARG